MTDSEQLNGSIEFPFKQPLLAGAERRSEAARTMKLLDTLERKLRPFAIPRLTLILVVVQVVGFALMCSGRVQPLQLSLIMQQVEQGEHYRLVSFLLVPAVGVDSDVRGGIVLFFTLWLFYLMGTVLEANWGQFRFNLYCLIAYLGTLVAAVLVPAMPASNRYIGLSVFLAFAKLYPDFVIRLEFIIPVKIKYLAMLTWLVLFIEFAFGTWVDCALVAASVGNYLLFFGKDIFRGLAHSKRQMEWHARVRKTSHQPFHNCTVCGANERTHPQMDFRYCSKCAGSYEYCGEHLKTHEHVALGDAAPAPADPT